MGSIALVINFLDAFSASSDTGNQVAQATLETALVTPAFLVAVMPLLILLSALSFALTLARHSEFVISRAAGQSAIQSLAGPGIIAFALGVASIFLFDPIAARLDQRADALKSNNSQSLQIRPTGFWVRQSTEEGFQIIKALRVENNGERLQQVTVFDHTKEGIPTARYFSPTAFLRDGELILTSGTSWDFSQNAESAGNIGESFGFHRIPTVIQRDQFLDGYPAPETLSPLTSGRVQKTLRAAGFSTLDYRSHNHHQFARPFLFLVMCFLGAALVLQSARFQRLEVAVLLALVFGFSLHFLQNFAKTLGSTGEIPLWVAAWSPLIAAAAGVLTFFLYAEDG